MDEEERIIFVGGSPRSGTTLIQHILDSHPNIAGGPEFDRTPDVVELRNKFHRSISIGRIDMFCSKEKVDLEIRNFLLNILLPFANRQNCKMLSEKTPSNILVFDDLIDIFSNSYFILVVRDPRAIVSSMLDVGKRAKKHGKDRGGFTKKLFLSACKADRDIKKGFKIYKNNTERILLVKYEDVLNYPKKETKKIAEYLDLKWSRDMLYPGEKNHPQADTGVKGWRTELTGGNIDKSGLDKWKKRLNDFEKMYLYHYFRNEQWVNDIGYDLSDMEISTIRKKCLLQIAKIYDFYEYYNVSLKYVRKMINGVIDHIE